MRIAVVALALLFAAPAFAQDAAPVAVAPVVAAQPSGVNVTIPVEQYIALSNAKAAAPAATRSAAVSSDGIFGIGWATLAGWLGAIAVFVFGLFKGAGALKAKQMLTAAAEGAWHIAERAGAIYSFDGATKGALALEAFVNAMGGSVNSSQVASARTLWEVQSAKAGLAAGASGVSLIAPAADPEKLAAAQAAAQAATSPGTATDLANQAAK